MHTGVFVESTSPVPCSSPVVPASPLFIHSFLGLPHFMFLDCGGVPTFFMIIGLAIAGMWRGLINPNESLESVV